jgi:hypothetical protein
MISKIKRTNWAADADIPAPRVLTEESFFGMPWPD